MEWWREVLIGRAAVGVTAAVIGVVLAKAYALGWAAAAFVCSRLSTPVATFFGKRWLEPTLTKFLEGWKARCALDRKKGLTGYERAERDRERRRG